mmetsp:Transcript_96528/g.272894  ORF Transcript_96528/g.272894 Transcript_96528/m.272894 type:complete len:202 (+) Transcript_96528:1244-1849(+)
MSSNICVTALHCEAVLHALIAVVQLMASTVIPCSGNSPKSRSASLHCCPFPHALMAALMLGKLEGMPHRGMSPNNRKASRHCWPRPQALMATVKLMMSGVHPCCSMVPTTCRTSAHWSFLLHALIAVWKVLFLMGSPSPTISRRWSSASFHPNCRAQLNNRDSWCSKRIFAFSVFSSSLCHGALLYDRAPRLSVRPAPRPF